MKNRMYSFENLSEFLLSKGMPRHCGLCERFKACSEGDPDQVCLWLKERRSMIKKMEPTRAKARGSLGPKIWMPKRPFLIRTLKGAVCWPRGINRINPLFFGILLGLFLMMASDAQAKKPQPPAPTPNASPQVISIVPDSVTVQVDSPAIFISSYADADGWQNISKAQLQINGPSNGRNCFYATYDQNSNKFYLRTDNNKKWLGGFAPGTSNIIENSYVLLDCSQSKITGSGTTLSVTWCITFKPTFTGTKNLYLYVVDDKGAYQEWLNMGTCSIVSTPQDATPPTGTIIINEGAQYTNAPMVALALSANDNEGGSGVIQMQFSNDNANWSIPEAYASGKDWSLSSGDALKTVYVRYCDGAGNWSQGFSGTIILDTTPPRVTIISPQDNEVIYPD